MSKLCVNIDHIATVREARKGTEPDPIIAARLAIEGGADGITVHLREDRRHINDRDVLLLSQLIKASALPPEADPPMAGSPPAPLGRGTLSSAERQPSALFTLEMAATSEMLEISKKIKPVLITLVPEKRQELTTEGGLDIISQKKYLEEYLKNLHKNNLTVSIFINPDKEQIKTAKEIGADFVEIHTGAYANNPNQYELTRVKDSILFAQSLGLKTNAGHGLNYENTVLIGKIPGIEQLHIGHSIISRAVFVGIKDAVKEMKDIIKKSALKEFRVH